MEDDITWAASKLSGAAGALGAEEIELYNWFLHFGCASEEFRVVVARLAECMSNLFRPWDAYCNLIACRLMTLDKRPGVRPVGIVETLRRDQAELVMRAAGVTRQRRRVVISSCAQASRPSQRKQHRP